MSSEENMDWQKSSLVTGATEGATAFVQSLGPITAKTKVGKLEAAYEAAHLWARFYVEAMHRVRMLEDSKGVADD